MELINIAILILLVITLLLLVLIYFKQIKASELYNLEKALKDDNQRSLQSFASVFQSSSQQSNQIVDTRLSELTKLLRNNQLQLNEAVTQSLGQIQKLLNQSSLDNEQKLNNIRETVENRLRFLQEENSKKLDEMRATVDEKLQKTLEDRISQSFKQVSDQLESVYKSLGEMSKIGSEVGDLKKVLSNVKTRGTLGEIQLNAILEQILSPEQYDKDVSTIPGSSARVEFAVKLPGSDQGSIYLPIDSKFPTESYLRLMEAYDTGEKDQIDRAAKELDSTLKSFAKSIHDKYIEAPYTTDFAILFLPFEGLYAEAVKRGLIEDLQRLYKINIAGPTTMAALLNSLQMGFKTLAIQKRSSEVWKVLANVKSEFSSFADVLSSAQSRINQTSQELDKLIGVRTRKIQRSLNEVSTLEIEGDPESEV